MLRLGRKASWWSVSMSSSPSSSESRGRFFRAWSCESLSESLSVSLPEATMASRLARSHVMSVFPIPSSLSYSSAAAAAPVSLRVFVLLGRDDKVALTDLGVSFALVSCLDVSSGAWACAFESDLGVGSLECAVSKDAGMSEAGMIRGIKARMHAASSAARTLELSTWCATRS